MDSLSFRLKLAVVNSSLSKPSDFYVDLICKAYISNELKIRSISVTVHDEKKLIRRGTSSVKYAAYCMQTFFKLTINSPDTRWRISAKREKLYMYCFYSFVTLFPACIVTVNFHCPKKFKNLNAGLIPGKN